MIEALKARLAGLARLGETIAYGDLAREFEIPAPSIATLTAILETLMEEDAAAKRPFLAAVMVGRLGDVMPSLGFFEKAVALDAALISDPIEFVRDQRRALREMS